MQYYLIWIEENSRVNFKFFLGLEVICKILIPIWIECILYWLRWFLKWNWSICKLQEGLILEFDALDDVLDMYDLKPWNLMHCNFGWKNVIKSNDIWAIICADIRIEVMTFYWCLNKINFFKSFLTFNPCNFSEAQLATWCSRTLL